MKLYKLIQSCVLTQTQTLSDTEPLSASLLSNVIRATFLVPYCVLWLKFLHKTPLGLYSAVTTRTFGHLMKNTTEMVFKAILNSYPQWVLQEYCFSCS